MTLEEWEAKHAPTLRESIICHMSEYNLIVWPDDETETRDDFVRAVLISVRDQFGNVARNDYRRISTVPELQNAESATVVNAVTQDAGDKDG